MARIEADIVEADVDGIAGVVATCRECGLATESRGTGPASRRRCLALLREGCEESEDNFYVDAADQAGDSRRPRDPQPRPWWEK